jgi:hypothetical protein
MYDPVTATFELSDLKGFAETLGVVFRPLRGLLTLPSQHLPVIVQGKKRQGAIHSY